MKKILIADDEKGVRYVIRCAMQNEGYEVIEADNGYEAINLIREELPDLVILDIQMPEMSGLEVTRIMREEVSMKNIPVFISTGEEGIRQEFDGLNIEAFIPKPYEVDILIDKLIRFFEDTK